MGDLCDSQDAVKQARKQTANIEKILETARRILHKRMVSSIYLVITSVQSLKKLVETRQQNIMVYCSPA